MLKQLLRFWNQIERWSMQVRLPFFEGLSLYDVSRFFFKGIVEGNVTSRAGSIAYSFFLALFPGIIFLFTLIPFFPVQNLEQEVFDVFERILPPDTWEASRETIQDVMKNKREGLLSLGFFLALIFTTNGINAIVTNFNQTVHDIAERPFWKQQLVSMGLTLVLSIFFLIGIVLIIFSSDVLNGILAFFQLDQVSPVAIELSRLGLLLALVFIGIVILYNYGTARRKNWRFFSPGAVLATFLIIISSSGFSYYVANFSQYNKLYGSIGTLMVILLWIYINALVLIIGFELNASIAQVKMHHKKRERELQEMDQRPSR